MPDCLKPPNETLKSVRKALCPTVPERSCPAEALIGRQSEPLDDLAELDRAVKEAQARVDADPGLVAPDWTLYALTAVEAEF
jgi:pyridoxine/pyridoxamine 5'-phosphate oxidase